MQSSNVYKEKMKEHNLLDSLFRKMHKIYEAHGMREQDSNRGTISKKKARSFLSQFQSAFK